jgi:hypothetical protein
MKPYPVDWQPIYLETEQTSIKVRDGYAQKMSLYNLTKDEFLDLAKKQGYSCPICNGDASDAPYRLSVDHDHTTNEIRGLLCNPCNYALGLFYDDPERLERAIHYLKQPGSGKFIPE